MRQFQFASIADELKEIKTICHCGKKANMVVRVDNGKVLKEGAQIEIGVMKNIFHCAENTGKMRWKIIDRS